MSVCPVVAKLVSCLSFRLQHLTWSQSRRMLPKKGSEKLKDFEVYENTVRSCSMREAQPEIRKLMWYDVTRIIPSAEHERRTEGRKAVAHDKTLILWTCALVLGLQISWVHGGFEWLLLNLCNIGKAAGYDQAFDRPDCPTNRDVNPKIHSF